MIINKIDRFVTFNGTYEPCQELKQKLNNINELNELAKGSIVDTINTHINNDRQFFPREDLFTTIATKRLANDKFFGVDCVIISKDASNEQISKSIFESAQRALRQLCRYSGK